MLQQWCQALHGLLHGVSHHQVLLRQCKFMYRMELRLTRLQRSKRQGCSMQWRELNRRQMALVEQGRHVQDGVEGLRSVQCWNPLWHPLLLQPPAGSGILTVILPVRSAAHLTAVSHCTTAAAMSRAASSAAAGSSAHLGLLAASRRAELPMASPHLVSLSAPAPLCPTRPTPLWICRMSGSIFDTTCFTRIHRWLKWSDQRQCWKNIKGERVGWNQPSQAYPTSASRRALMAARSASFSAPAGAGASPPSRSAVAAWTTGSLGEDLRPEVMVAAACSRPRPPSQ